MSVLSEAAVEFCRAAQPLGLPAIAEPPPAVLLLQVASDICPLAVLQVQLSARCRMPLPLPQA